MTTRYGSKDCGLAALATDPPEHLELLQESADALLSAAGGVRRVRDHRDRDPGFDPAVWRRMAEAGWLGLLQPEHLGGVGLGHLELCVLAERLGVVLAPEPFASAAVLANSILAEADNTSLRDRLLPQALAGELIPALAWQTNGGEGVRLDVGGGRLYGGKALVRPIGGADGFIVSVETADRTALYWLDKDAPGLRVERDLLTDGSFAGRLSLDGAPATDLLFQDTAAGARILERAVDRARLAASAELVGLMKQAFDITAAYLQDRTQFRKPLASFQAIQHRLTDLYIQHRLACASVLAAARALDSGDDDIAAAAAVSAAKARCSAAAMTVVREAVQLHGAIGYTDEYDIGLYLKRALVLSAWLGNAKFHRRRFAQLSPAA